MNDLETLRPEVQAAMRTMNGQAGGNRDDAYDVIEAELLRLDKINRILEIKNAGTLANNLCPDHRDKQTFRPCLACLLEKSEAELAALKARIAEAPTAQLIDQGRVTQQWYVRATDGGLLALPPALSGKRVRLVVEK